jgi:hypothetical protein
MNNESERYRKGAAPDARMHGAQEEKHGKEEI